MEARVMWVLLQHLAYAVANFFQKELNHHCGMYFSEAVGMNCGECVWLEIFCTNSNVNALTKLCMTN